MVMVCESCKKEFIPRRKSSKFCSNKCSNGHKGLFRRGKKRPVFSKEWRRNISKSLRGKPCLRRGSDSNLWKGGISSKPGYHQKILKERSLRIWNTGGRHTNGEWETLKAQYNWTCPSCKKSESEIKLTRDHIVPLSRGGSDNIENIQPLCMPCNAKKHTKTIKY